MKPKVVNLSDLCKFTPKQLLATTEADKHDYTLFGGAAGPGKSYWLRWYPIRKLLQWGKQYNLKGIRGALFSEDFPTLKDRQISKMEVEFPRWLGEIKDTKSHGLGFHLRPEFGSHVLSLKNLDDPSKYLSSEFAIIAVEELTMNPEDKFHKLRSRLRWTGIPNPKFIAATNPGQIGHCVPYGEVLTKEGWKDIKEVVVGEMVATMDDGERLVFSPIDHLCRHSYTGEMHSFKSTTATIECTPYHTLYRRTETKTPDGRTFHAPSPIRMQDVSGTTRVIRSIKHWEGTSIASFQVVPYNTRKTRLKQPSTVNGNDYCELMGWFLSEGCTLDRDKEFGISQTKPLNRIIIKNLLDRCGFSYRETPTAFSVSSPAWWSYLRQFGKCRDKFIPESLKQASSEQLSILLKSLMLGDGHDKTYYTISKRLADDVQEIGLKLGYSPALSSRSRQGRRGLSYAVNLRLGRDCNMEKRAIRSKHWEGTVYCLGIPKLHRFFLRQKGTIWLSGNSWVKKRWIDRNFPEEEQGIADQFCYVPALPTDNPYLAASYLKTLASLEPKLRKAYLEGNWDVFEGQYFSEWDQDIHVCEPFEIPDTWRRIRSIDHGRTAPTACLWGAIDHDGRIWWYREYYKAGEDADLNAKEIARLSNGESYWVTVMDSACFSKQGYGETIADIYRNNGVYSDPWPKNRLAGWALFHEYLRNTPKEPVKMVFFKTCFNSIREIPLAIHDDVRPEDIDTDGSDHALDAIRGALEYMAEQKTPKPRDPVEEMLWKIKKKDSLSPLNINQFYNRR